LTHFKNSFEKETPKNCVQYPILLKTPSNASQPTPVIKHMQLHVYWYSFTQNYHQCCPMGCVKAKRQQTIKRRQKSIKSNYEITADVGATKIVVVIYKAQLTTTMTSKSAKMFVVSGQQQKVSKKQKETKE